MDKFELLKLAIYWFVGISCGTSVIMGAFLYFTIKFNAWNRFSREFFCKSNGKLDKDGVEVSITPCMSTLMVIALVVWIIYILLKCMISTPITWVYNKILSFFENEFNKLEEENMKHNNPIENIKNKR